MVPQVLAMLQVDFPTSERPKAMSLYGMTLAVGGIGGPLLGGVLLEADLFGLDWRPIFFVNVPIGLAALLAAAVLARESHSERRATFDVRGTLIATLGLLFPLVPGRELHWPWWTFALIAACPSLLWLFLRHERRVARRGDSPLMDPGLLRHRSAVGGLLVAVLFFCGMAYQVVLTVHLQSGEGYSPLGTALALATFTVGVGLGSGLAPRLMPLGRRVVILGAAVIASGMAVVTLAVHASGAASSLINTAIQVGVATGVPGVATGYFWMLDGGEPPAESAVAGLLTVVGLYVLSALLALVLPPGRIRFADDGPEDDGPEDVDPDDEPRRPERAVPAGAGVEEGAATRYLDIETM